MRASAVHVTWFICRGGLRLATLAFCYNRRMSYQVLARKWRPRDFTTLVGQEHVVKALTHALEQQRLHHAYLFTGTRGVGKTTLSRILAKSLNCIGPDGNGTVTAQPCGVCRACTEIDSGRFVDYIEMDAASNRGVDEMAQLLDKAIYAPSSGRFKVYMIDEVHMLTNHAFNAMLKTLEEPPEHVKFILATTDPQKIPVTVLSRCLQFNLKQMPPAQIVGHLEHILQAEQISFEATALRLLAQAAQGSMRDGLSLTDQAIAYSAGEVTEAAVRGMLGAIDQSYLIRLLDALAVQDGPGVLSVADEMTGRSLSFAGALQDLASLLHKIALVQVVPDAVQNEWPEAQDIVRFASLFDAQEVQLYYQIANLGRNELALAPDEYAGFTMTLLRMLAFRPHGVEEGSGGQRKVGSTPHAAPSAPLSVRPASTTVSALPTRSVAPALGVAQPPAPPYIATPDASPARPVEPTPMPSEAPPPVASGLAASASASPERPLSPAMAALAAARAGREGGRGRTRPTAGSPATSAGSVTVPEVAAAPPAVAESNDVAVPEGAARVSPSADASKSRARWDDVPDMPPAPPDDLPWLEPGQTESPSASPEGGRAASPAAEIATATTSDGESRAQRLSSPVAAAPIAVESKPLSAASSAAAAALPGGSWIAFARALPAKGLVQQLAYQSELVSLEDGVCTLRVALAHLTEGTAAERFQALLSQHLPTPVKIQYEIGQVSETVAIADAQAQAAAQAAAEASIQGDPFIQALVRDFDARIVPESIRPRAG